MKRKYYISVMGTMGSGKTTAARLLARELKFHLLEENFGDNAFLPRFYKDMSRWAFHSQTFFLMEKVTQMFQASVILRSRERSEGRREDPIRVTSRAVSGIIQDTPIQQDVFSYAKAQHELGNMDDAEWKLYLKIYESFSEHLPKPNLIIFLETSIEQLEQRIESRGRGYEQKIPRSYIELLDQLNHEWLNKNKTIPVVQIQTDGLNIVTSKQAQHDMIAQVRQTLKLKL